MPTLGASLWFCFISLVGDFAIVPLVTDHWLDSALEVPDPMPEPWDKRYVRMSARDGWEISIV